MDFFVRKKKKKNSSDVSGSPGWTRRSADATEKPTEAPAATAPDEAKEWVTVSRTSMGHLWCFNGMLWWFIYMILCVYIYLFIYLCIYLFMYLFIYLFTYLFIYLFIYLYRVWVWDLYLQVVFSNGAVFRLQTMPSRCLKHSQRPPWPELCSWKLVGYTTIQNRANFEECCPSTRQAGNRSSSTTLDWWFLSLATNWNLFCSQRRATVSSQTRAWPQALQLGKRTVPPLGFLSGFTYRISHPPRNNWPYRRN